MEKKIIENFEKFFDFQLLKDYKNEIRNKICKELDELRKKDNETSRSIERLEVDIFSRFIGKTKDSNLENLIRIYDNLSILKYDFDRFIYLLNKE